MHVRRVTMTGLLMAMSLSGLLTAQAASAARLYDFAAQGVIIWSQPRAGSSRNGLGYAGQGFQSDRVERHALYQCDHFASDEWHHGRNVTTGVVGWVPACNLADPD
ncbi:hypothetical protein ABGB18_26755 [Nonomuraea sp. B12E4]|uniref:hypothetical protein n=1 Tax=Nonomuraea sp. B12E4 TaxID=3153564 RepID=UPI00325EE00F